MSGKRVISIRFHTDNKEDMELYKRLEEEAGTSASLAAVVKAKIKDAYDIQEKEEFQNRIITTLQEEMHKIIKEIIRDGISALQESGKEISVLLSEEKNILPQKGEELPDGALDFLE